MGNITGGEMYDIMQLMGFLRLYPKKFRLDFPPNLT